MTGAIPAYGTHYRLTRRPEWKHGFTNSVYVHREFNVWSIQAESGSKTWWVYYTDTPVGRPFPSLTFAMRALNVSISYLYGNAASARSERAS